MSSLYEELARQPRIQGRVNAELLFGDGAAGGIETFLERSNELQRQYGGEWRATLTACEEERYPFGFMPRVPRDRVDLEMIEIRLRSLCKRSNINLCERRFRKDLETVDGSKFWEPNRSPLPLTIGISDSVRLALSTFRRAFVDVMAAGQCDVDPAFGHWSEALSAECRETLICPFPNLLVHGGQLRIYTARWTSRGPWKLTKAAAFEATVTSIIEWQDRVIDQALGELRNGPAE